MNIDPTRLAFLRQLTLRHPELVVWKHLDRALRGRGDVDAAVPADRALVVREDAIRIAPTTLGASAVITCDHVADKRLQFFVQSERLPQLFELDLCTQPARGLAPWADPRGLAELSVVGDEGVRRLRTGAEAVVSLVYHGLSRGGRYRLTGDEGDLVTRGVRAELPAALDAAGALPPGPARAPLRELVLLLEQGGWDRSLARRAYAGFLSGALVHPVFATRRARFRLDLAAGRECTMSRLARLHGRRVAPAGLNSLLAEARATGHAVLDLC